MSRLLQISLTARHRHFFDSTQVPFACAEQWDVADLKEAVRTRNPQVRQSGLLQLIGDFSDALLHRLVQHNQSFAFGSIRDGRDCIHDLGLIVRSLIKDPSNLLLDADMRHHLTADLGKATLAASDLDESFIIDLGQSATSPLAANNEERGTSSEMMPYFAVLSRALCVPNRNKTANIVG